jgi:hypothetical protein
MHVVADRIVELKNGAQEACTPAQRAGVVAPILRAVGPAERALTEPSRGSPPIEGRIHLTRSGIGNLVTLGWITANPPPTDRLPPPSPRSLKPRSLKPRSPWSAADAVRGCRSLDTLGAAISSPDAEPGTREGRLRAVCGHSRTTIEPSMAKQSGRSLSLAMAAADASHNRDIFYWRYRRP